MDRDKEHLEKGLKLVKLGNFLAAIDSYKKAIESNPANLRAYLDLGSLLVRMRRDEEGISVLQETIEKFPKNSVGYVFLGAALSRQGKKEAAKEFFQKAVSLDSRQPLWVYDEASMQALDIIEIKQYKIAYFPIPKCGSSTLKSVFHKLETGEFTINPHPHYNNPFFKTQNQKIEDYANHFKFVIVRDPVKRFISYFYKNIITDRSIWGLFGNQRYVFGLDCTPDINFFIQHLDEYIYNFIDVRHHNLCQHAYIGDSLTNYDLIGKLEDFHLVAEKIQSIAGKELEFPKLMGLNKSAENYFPEVSLKSLKMLIDYYEKDYELLKDYYSPEEILQEYHDWLIENL